MTDHNCHKPPEEGAEPPLTLKIDVEHYMTYLSDMDIPDAEKRELIEIVYSIVLQFVELGFGISTVDQALDAKNRTDAYNATSDKLNSPVNFDSDTIKAVIKEKENT